VTTGDLLMVHASVRALGPVVGGVNTDTISLLHHAEHLAQIPDKRIVRYRRPMTGADGPEWTEFEEFDTSEPVSAGLPPDCFERIAHDYLAAGHGRQGKVGNADTFLLDGSALVKFAIAWLERAAARP
jgi:aminoglycoside 3-N-acetyltransferase